MWDGNQDSCTAFCAWEGISPSLTSPISPPALFLLHLYNLVSPHGCIFPTWGSPLQFQTPVHCSPCPAKHRSPCLTSPLTSIHPSSCPHLFTHPVQSPLGPVSSQPLHFHSHYLGGVSSPVYGPSPTMTPLPLLFPFHLILLPGLLKSTFLSVLTFSVQSLSRGSWLWGVSPPPTPKILCKRTCYTNKQQRVCIFSFLDNLLNRFKTSRQTG